MTLSDLAERLKRNVVVVDDLAGALESYVLTLGFRAATWVSVIPTLVLTSRTIQQVAGMDAGSALASSVALELVGQATVNQWIREADWDRDKGKSEAAGRARWLFGAMCVYFAADFVFVGILEVPRAFNGQWAHLAMLIFPLMQVIATLVMVERVAQTRREALAEQARAERAAQRAAKRIPPGERSVSRSVNHSGIGQAEGADRPVTGQSEGEEILPDRPETDSLASLTLANRSRAAKRQAVLETLLTVFRNDPHISYAEAGRTVGRSKAWVVGAVADLEAGGQVERRNGDGVVVLTSSPSS